MAKIGFNSRVIKLGKACLQAVKLSCIYTVSYRNIYNIVLYQSFALKCLLKQSTEYLEMYKILFWARVHALRSAYGYQQLLFLTHSFCKDSGPMVQK